VVLAAGAGCTDRENSVPCDADVRLTGPAIDLFDGATLGGWDGDPTVWRVTDGVIVGAAEDGAVDHNTFLIASGSFGDFVLTAEVMLVGGVGNSGIQYRSTVADPERWIVEGYQADVTADRWGNVYEERLGRSDLVYTSEACVAAVDVDGWNRYEITANGCSLTHRINGVLCAVFGEGDPDRPREGSIALQYHTPGGFEVRYRDVRVAALIGP
jgi:hypothetical protein